MNEKELQRTIKWLIVIMAGVLAISLFTRRDFHGAPGPVWKSSTIQNVSSVKH